MCKLTISIITYNRKKYLVQIIESILTQIELDNLHNDVEIVVSDNNSIDDTCEYMNGIINQNLNVKIVYNKNETNQGSVGNIIKALEISSGKFWMLYGDDDLVGQNGLKQIVSVVKQSTNTAAFMFKCLQNNFVKPTDDFKLTIKEAAQQYFYNFGNAGVFAIETTYARAALKEHYHKIKTTCWPQTELGFRAMHISGYEKPFYVKGITSSSSPNHNSNNYSSWYIFETMYYSLLRVSLNMKDIFGDKFIHDAYKGLLSNISKSVKYNLFFYSTFFDTKTETEKTKATLKEALKLLPFPYKKNVFIYYLIVNVAPIWFKKVIFNTAVFLKYPTSYDVNKKRILGTLNRVSKSSKEENFCLDTAMYGYTNK